MFDFEDDTFFNRTEVTLTGNRDTFDSWYKQILLTKPLHIKLSTVYKEFGVK